MNYPVPPNRIPRRKWGIRVASVTDFAPDYFGGKRNGIGSRILDRFFPFIVIAAGIAITLVVTPILALVMVSL